VDIQIKDFQFFCRVRDDIHAWAIIEDHANMFKIIDLAYLKLGIMYSHSGATIYINTDLAPGGVDFMNIDCRWILKVYSEIRICDFNVSQFLRDFSWISNST